MEAFFRICLGIAGFINAAPVALAFLPEKISSSYGIELMSPSLELLLRHRAILFGLVGGLMIYSAITKKHYSLAVLIGFISMLSFVLFGQLIDGAMNPELSKVMWIDIVGIVILMIGYLGKQLNRQKVSAN